jgi:site-specific recombinase XerD
MAGALDTIAQVITGNEATTRFDVPWHGLRFQHTAAIRARLQELYSHATANKMLSALRGVLRAAWDLEQMSGDDYHRAVSVKNVKGETIPAGRSIPQGELLALLNTCGQDMTGIRDAAVISLLYAGGLRRAELVSLAMGDYDRVDGRLRVKGKRNKERLVPIVNGAAAALADWLAVRGDGPGPLFIGLGNRQRGGKLTTQAIYKMLKERAAAAGIPELSPHDFRRTFVGDLLDAGADIVTVQKMAGHASVETTARYDRRGERAKEQAAQKLHVPYTRRVLATE